MDLIHQGRHTDVYRMRIDGRQVVAKVLRGPYPSEEVRSRFEREIRITQRVEGSGIINVVAIDEFEGMPRLVLDDFGAHSLAIAFRNARPAPSLVVRLALQATDALASVHEAHIVHKDVNPSNLVWNAETDRLALIDFGISSQSDAEAGPTTVQELEGTLRYIAPEQTGRVGQSVDRRSDYYSLGATLYELLAGRPPFLDEDMLALVHAHVAKRPAPLQDMGGVPPSLAEVVMKLLEKSPADRYQSAEGLRHDLRECARLIEAGSDTCFPLGTADVARDLSIPNRLYGRQAELRALVSVARRAAEGEVQLGLVSGPGGVGKTALVEALWRELATSRTQFARGKFEQFSRDEPYSALTKAFAGLGAQLLMLASAPLETIRVRLQNALGVHGRALEELVPSLSPLLGRTAPLPPLAPAEAEVRVHRALSALIRAVASDKEPLVLLLDDLQWADASSLRFLDALLASDCKNLMVLGTYRRAEVGPEHGLTTLTSKAYVEERCTRVDLEPLDRQAVIEMLTDALEPAADPIEPLADVAIAKTRGNPFYLRRFLRAVSREDHLSFDPRARVWRWQLNAIRDYAASENVAEFMASKIAELPEATQETLMAASILGDRFNLEDVSDLLSTDLNNTREALAAAVREELVFSFRVRDGGAFQFAHDRIRQAARSCLDDATATSWHARIGRRLSSQKSPPLFELVHHLNRASAHLSEEERTKLAEHNLEAGQRALMSVAYAPALNFFDSGLANTPTREVALSLHLGAAEAAYLSGHRERANVEVDTVLRLSDDSLAQAMALRIRMRQAVSGGALSEAVDIGIEALGRLDVDLPRAPTKLSIAADMARTGLRLRGTAPLSRVDDPELTDPVQSMALELLAEIAPPVYLARQDLLPLLGCAMARIIAEHGVNDLASYGYALYALVLSAFGDYSSARDYGDLAEKLGERFPNERIKGRRAQLLQGFVRHWSRAAKDGCAPLAEGFELAVDAGDFVWGAFCAQMYIILSFLSGADLRVLEPEARRYTDATAKLNQEHALAVNECYVRATANLRRGASDPTRLGEEAPLHATLAAQENNTGLFNFFFVRLFLAVVHRSPEAPELAKKAGRYIDAVPATYCVPAFLALEVFASTQNWEQLSMAERARLLPRAAVSQARLKRWAKRTPINHASKMHLVEAELARVMGRKVRALAEYDRAIEAARKNGNRFDEALAGEMAARYQRAMGNARLAIAYERESAYAYGLWGAEAKAMSMGVNTPSHSRTDRILTSTHSSTGGTHSSAGTGTGQGDLDAEAVAKVSHALSEHLVLDDLVRSLVSIALEVGGGTRAVLVGAGERVEASVEAGKDAVRATSSIEDFGGIPLSVFRYVRRTQQDVLLSDAFVDGAFAQDPVIRDRQIRSVLCLPVVHQATLRAVLYVENDMLPDAFSSRQVEMLRLLTAQAAISLENAALFSNLEESLEAQVRLTTAHSRFVPHQFLQALERDQIVDVRLGDHVEKEMSILFSDIRGFTTIVENLSPAESIAFINRYLSFMEPAIIDHGGFVDSYIGDAIMALFDGPSDNAVAAAVAMQRALRELNAGRPGQTPVECGVGVNTGALMLGTIGGSTSLKCGVIGDSVNLASRVESLTKHYGVPLLISNRTRDALKSPGAWGLRHVERIVPVGTSEPVTLFEVIDADIRNGEAKRAAAPLHAEAVDHYYSRRFGDARRAFEAAQKHHPDDRVTQKYIDRCLLFLRDGVDDAWDGVIRMQTKS
ncbi:MAG: putative ATPase/class 3 adenylate cyclase/tRNA A-37 threonylcarbamoyl transferase component Bud32 [Polyangiales bacterium]